MASKMCKLALHTKKQKDESGFFSTLCTPTKAFLRVSKEEE